MSQEKEGVIKPIQTANVSFDEAGTPYSLDFNDIYFQPKEGLLESLHVFCDANDLQTRFISLTDKEKPIFVIGEVGFGTGLNFLNVMQLWQAYAPKNAILHYIATEKYPLKKADLIRALGVFESIKKESKWLIDAYPILTPGKHRIHFESITLTLMLEDALDAFMGLLVSNHLGLAASLKSFCVDAWLLDGFTPQKNKSAWSSDLCQAMAALSYEKTTLSSFSVARQVKDALVLSGFKLQKRKGYGLKREMLIARFYEIRSYYQDKRGYYQTPWHHQKTRPLKGKKVCVIGAGLAGCTLSYKLAKRGYEVVLIDRQEALANEASGNKAGLLDIKLSHTHSLLKDFMLRAFLYAIRFYKALGITTNQGLINIALSELEKSHHEKLRAFLKVYPELGRLLECKEVNALSGLTLNKEGLYLPSAGLLHPKKICEALLKSQAIDVRLGVEIKELKREANRWILDDIEADIVVAANSLGALSFSPLSSLPLTPFQGTVDCVKARDFTKSLKIPLSGKGYMTPLLNDTHLIGEGALIDYLFHNKALEVVSQRHGIRAKTPDYLPLVGSVPEVNQMKETFQLLKKDSKHFVPYAGDFHPNLYILAGFGSHGLSSIPLASEILASVINHEPPPIDTKTLKALSSARFLIKSLSKSD